MDLLGILYEFATFSMDKNLVVIVPGIPVSKCAPQYQLCTENEMAITLHL